MAIRKKYKGQTDEKTEAGISYSETFYGTEEECREKFEATPVGLEGDPEHGTVKNVKLYRDSGDIFNVEISYSKDSEGNSPDDNAYGQKSATLSTGMLSMPVETASGYRKNWNYYLAAKTSGNVPDWWNKADYDDVMSAEDSQKYTWIKSPSELPSDSDTKQRWVILKNPQKPGVENREIPTYQVTESAKFRSANSAGAMVSRRLGKIGRPEEDFGCTPSGFDWKCDSVSVHWSGKYWLATMTWTRSGDSTGWDKDLYQLKDAK